MKKLERILLWQSSVVERLDCGAVRWRSPDMFPKVRVAMEMLYQAVRMTYEKT